MSARLSCCVVFAVVLGGALPSAGVAASTGGAKAPEAPAIKAVRCVPSKLVTCLGERAAPPGANVRVLGRSMDNVRAVTFRGRAGRRDNVTVRPRHTRRRHLEAVVPRRARSGPVAVRGVGGTRSVSPEEIDVAKPPTLATAGATGHVFPIRGKHDLGQSETNNFGGGRGHEGQDMFAACGTPLVAAQGGTVKFAESHARAGNYIVVTGAESGWDYVYMHMRRPALVRRGDSVRTGEPIGEVGATGNASGCHLHFELWSSPGWYDGGKPFDPLPQLRAWKAEA